MTKLTYGLSAKRSIESYRKADLDRRLRVTDANFKKKEQDIEIAQ